MAGDQGDRLTAEELRHRVRSELLPLLPAAVELLSRALQGNQGRGQAARFQVAMRVLDVLAGRGESARLEVSGKLDLAALVLRSMEPEAVQVEAHQVERPELPAGEPEAPRLVVARPPTIRRKAGGEP